MDTDIDTLKNNWSEIDGFIQKGEISLAELYRIQMQLGSDEVTGDYLEAIGEIPGGYDDAEAAAKKFQDAINNYDYTQGLEGLFNQLAEIDGEAGAAQYMMEHMGDNVPDEIKTYFKLVTLTEAVHYDDLTSGGKQAFNKWYKETYNPNFDRREIAGAHTGTQAMAAFTQSDAWQSSYINKPTTEDWGDPPTQVIKFEIPNSNNGSSTPKKLDRITKGLKDAEDEAKNAEKAVKSLENELSKLDKEIENTGNLASKKDKYSDYINKITKDTKDSKGIIAQLKEERKQYENLIKDEEGNPIKLAIAWAEGTQEWIDTNNLNDILKNLVDENGEQLYKGLNLYETDATNLTEYVEGLREFYNNNYAGLEFDSDSPQAKLKSAIETIIGNSSDYLNNVESYEEKITSTDEKIYDEQKKAYESKIKLIQLEIEALKELQEQYFQLNDFSLQFFGEKFSIDKGNLINSNALQEISLANEGLKQLALDRDELLKSTGIVMDGETSYDFSQIDIEALKENISDTIEQYQIILDATQKTFEAITSCIDTMSEKIEFTASDLETYIFILDSYSSIIETLGDRIDSNTIKNINQISNNIKKDQINYNRQYATMIKESEMAAKRELDELLSDPNSNDTLIQYWEEQYNILHEKSQELTEELFSLTSDLISSLQEQATTAIETSFKELEKSISSSGLSLAQTFYENAAEAEKRYLSPVRKEYELSKMMRQLQKDITDNSTLAARTKLADIYEEIADAQKSTNKMSEYELTILQKKYDLRLAEIALEEAQNNKTSMRLVRDASGNWTYAYTADQNKIDQAQQAVEDKQYELYNASLDNAKNYESQYLSDIQAYEDAIKELDVNSSTYQADLTKLNDYYTKKITHDIDQTKKSYEGMGKSFKDSTLSQITDATSWEDLVGRALEFIGKSTEENTLIVTKYGEEVKSTTEAAGLDISNFSTDTVGSLQDINDAAYSSYEKIVGEDGKGGYVADFKEALIGEDGNGGLLKSAKDVSEVLKSYDKITFDNLLNGPNGLVEVLERIKDLQDFEKVNVHTPDIKYDFNIKDDSRDYAEEMINLLNSTDPFLISVPAEAMTWEDFLSFVENSENSDSDVFKKLVELNNLRNEKIDKNNLNYYKISLDDFKDFYNKSTSLVEILDSLKNLLNTDANGNPISSFASGGYTGDWQDGKLAVLHQKELVLNANDTENILKAVDIARIISNTIGLATAMQLAPVNTVPTIPSTSQALDQNVHIEANFPNVSSADEIELALSNLVNEAAQYANIK